MANWRIAGKPEGAEPEVGKTYKCIHTRKGEFWFKVTSISDIWARGVVTDGVAKAIMSYNVSYEGDEIAVRDTLCTLVEVGES
jgi:hypothetical protein